MSRERRTIFIQIGLFIATCLTTTIAGAEFCFGKSIYRLNEDNTIGFNDAFTWNDFLQGTQFSVPFLLILTVHEFGHYFTAMYHKVKASLPYYIPIPSLPFFPSLIGTMGAVIRLRSRVVSNVQHFDIGLAGPLAGFVLAIGIVWYGFATLPPPEYVFEFHPEYAKFGTDYADHVYSEEYIKSEGKAVADVLVGTNLLFEFFARFVADPERVPNPHEMMHYPILLAGFIALFFTSLNLLPIGQLDGGHIMYGLLGRKGHSLIASVFFVVLVFYAGLGAVNIHTDKDDVYWLIPLMAGLNYIAFKGLGMSRRDTLMYALIVFAIQFVITAVFPTINGYRSWIFFALIIGRMVGVHHPPSEIEQPLDMKRIILGWFALIIFLISFSPKPILIEFIQP